MFYEKVKEYCERNGIPIKAFEKMCGLGNGTVAGWKENRNNPRLDTLKKIESATQIPMAKWVD